MSNLGLIGKKIGMTRIYQEDGAAISVTVIDITDNVTIQRKTKDNDGYEAVQVGFDEQKEHRLKQPQKFHNKKYQAKPKKIVREFPLDNDEELPVKAGQSISAEIFKEGQYVDIIGKTKGKGFQGVYKRYGFGGLPASHGSMMHRRPGGVGAGTWPGRIWKNKKMPGRHGNYRRTIHNLKIVKIRKDDNALLVSGSVPGSKNSYVVIRPAIRKKK